MVGQADLNKQKDKLERYQAIRDPRAIVKEEMQTLEDDVKVAEARLNQTQAALLKTERLMDRLIVRAPRDGTILQVEIREGERASNSKALILLGNLDHFQLRADIDEENAGYFDKRMPAVAFPKNNTAILIPLRFVRIEPYVVPKKSLTGTSAERVDTRVLQVIYAFDPPKDYPIYVGQQVDIYIEKKAITPLEQKN